LPPPAAILTVSVSVIVAFGKLVVFNVPRIVIVDKTITTPKSIFIANTSLFEKKLEEYKHLAWVLLHQYRHIFSLPTACVCRE
jgi:hypothetical protein